MSTERTTTETSERVIDTVEADVALTADHGQAMGELGQWGHPGGSLLPVVRRVPWTVVNASSAVVSETDKQVPTDQLAALGYVGGESR